MLCPNDMHLAIHRWVGRGMSVDMAVSLARGAGDQYPVVRDALAELVGVDVDRLTPSLVGQLEATVRIHNAAFRPEARGGAANPLEVDATFSLSMLANLGNHQHKARDVLEQVVTAAKAALLVWQNRMRAAAVPPEGPLAAPDYTGAGAVARGTEATFVGALKAVLGYSYMPGLQQLSSAVQEYHQEVAREQEESARLVKASERPLRAHEVAAMLQVAEQVLEIKINGHYVACAQQLSWIQQWAKANAVPTDGRTDPEVLKRWATTRGQIMHHADGVADKDGVTKMMSTEFDKLRHCPKTWSMLHDNFRCFLVSLLVTQDLGAATLWVTPLRVFVFLDEFCFYTRGMPLESAYKFRVDMLEWLQVAVTPTCTLSQALQDALPVMMDRAKLIEYAGGGGAGTSSTAEVTCPRCVKKDKALDAAKAEIDSLKDRRASSEASRNREHNGRRSASRGRGASGSRPRDARKRVRLASPPPHRERGGGYDRRRRDDRRREWSRSPRR